MLPESASVAFVEEGSLNVTVEKRIRNQSKRPFVLINMAMSADGKIATANRKIDTLGSEHDRLHLLELRSTVDCVITGARTINSGKITLGPGGPRFRKQRRKHGLAEYNLRVIVSGTGSVDAHAEIFQHRFSPVIVLTTEQIPADKLETLRAVSDEVKVCGAREIDFGYAFRWLNRKWNVNRLLCEGGGDLNDAVLQSGLVNEVHLTICPFIIGGADAPAIAEGNGAALLDCARPFRLDRRKRVGDELYLTFQAKL